MLRDVADRLLCRRGAVVVLRRRNGVEGVNESAAVGVGDPDEAEYHAVRGRARGRRLGNHGGGQKTDGDERGEAAHETSTGGDEASAALYSARCQRLRPATGGRRRFACRGPALHAPSSKSSLACRQNFAEGKRGRVAIARLTSRHSRAGRAPPPPPPPAL